MSPAAKLCKRRSTKLPNASCSTPSYGPSENDPVAGDNDVKCDTAETGVGDILWDVI